ncbi:MULTISPECIES: hypothetical protein [unclassified Burkholderia]|uniref:hypothetical protein n=1 Tax=unclassified Burkholderia TaxID=2613784 RepID=UPI002AAF527D|nr:MULTISPECIES: hypothetical protein [unclassified Burkholderia]
MSAILSNTRPKAAASGESSVAAQNFKLRPLTGGAVLFDNRDDMTDGWACAHGGEPFRIRNPSHLPNDVIWVCNAEYNTFQLQQSRLHHLRRDDYFRATLAHIAADLGMRIEGEYARTTVQKLGEIVHRTFTQAVTLYGRNGLPLAPREGTLAEDIRRTMPAMSGLTGADYLRQPLAAAYQSYSTPIWSDRRDLVGDLVSVLLRLNRVDYANALLSKPVPDEAWHYVPEEAVKGAIDPWLDPARPSLVEVQVVLQDEIGELIAYGAQPGKRAGLRTWVSQPELEVLVKHAEVYVKAAFCCRHPHALPESYQLPMALQPATDPALSMVYSAGLIAECHWHALANPPWSRQRRETETFPINVWQRAYDRAACFEKALMAFNEGFVVKGYGNGSLLLRVPRDELRRLLRFAMREGFMHPSFPAIFLEHDATLPDLLEDL